MLPLDIFCCTLTTGRNIELTGFNIKSGICWHMEMKNIKAMKSLIYRSSPISAPSKGTVQSLLLYCNCVPVMLAPVTDNMNFHYNGICYINEYWYRFLCSTIYRRKYSKKKNHYVFNFSLFPTLEAYLAFYQRYVMFSPFQCLITPYSSQCLVQSRQEIADEEMSWIKCGTKANEGNSK